MTVGIERFCSILVYIYLWRLPVVYYQWQTPIHYSGFLKNSILSSRTAQQEELVRRVRYPRHINPDSIVRPYLAYEATGFYILNVISLLLLIRIFCLIIFQRLDDGNIAKKETYVAHITCSNDPLSWLMATSK